MLGDVKPRKTGARMMALLSSIAALNQAMITFQEEGELDHAQTCNEQITVLAEMLDEQPDGT